MDPLTLVNTRATAQTLPADPRQSVNNAGGYTFGVDADTRIHRFLTLGTTGGTYYASERALTVDNADVVLDAARTRGTALVDAAVAVSTAGRAPRNNPALFALAAAAGVGDVDTRAYALDRLPQVARTGTHLFTFAGYAQQFRGWGRGLRRAVGGWYLRGDVDDVAYQVVKYRQRDGWTHRDLLRLAHPDTAEGPRRALFDWVCGRDADPDAAPDLVGAFRAAHATTDVATWVRLVGAHPLSWEMLPDAALAEPKVWHALIARGMPQTALMRQLPRLTRLGVLTGATLGTVTAQLVDVDRLRKGRVHPINVLVAARTYASGRSAAGSGAWEPRRPVVDALDAAFYAAFGAVVPSGKRTLVALDVSGSMSYPPIAGMPLTPREASAALALVTMATEPDVTCVGFTAAQNRTSRRSVLWGGWANTEISELTISPRQRLDDAIAAVSDLPFGGTDCALPFTWAGERGHLFDTVMVVTDNESWAGPVHVHQALAAYRQATGIPTRMVVAAMTATEFSVADPADRGSLDVVGFDAATPNLVADFSRGDL